MNNPTRSGVGGDRRPGRADEEEGADNNTDDPNRASRPRLAGGWMTGVEPGDRFSLAPPGPTLAPIGSALVGRCGAASAELAIDRDGDGDAITDVAVAIPQGYARPRGRVRLRVTPAIEALLRRALPRSGVIAIADDNRQAEDVVAEVVERDGDLTICRPRGAPLRAPLPLHSPPSGSLPAILAYVAETLEVLAFARALADLEPPSGLELDPTRAAWKLRVTDVRGGALNLAPAAATIRSPLLLGPGRRLFVTLRSALRSSSALYGWVLWIGPSGQVKLLSRYHPSGAPVGADTPYFLGERPLAIDEGIELRAAPALPPGGPTRGELVLIAADGQADLRGWERAAKALRPGDPVVRPVAARGLPIEHITASRPGRATCFAVWHVPVDLGGAYDVG